MIMINNKKNDEVSCTIIMILNFEVNFNYKKNTHTRKKEKKVNISVNINMRTSIVMEKLKPGHQYNSLCVLVSKSYTE